MSFEYNDDGIRTSKTVNGVETIYYMNGGQIVAEKTGTRTIVYIYDASGAPIGMMYRTTSYAEGAFDVFWYEKNLQGDIVAVYNSSGTKLVTYDYYDAWGNYTVSYSNSGATTGAQYNPFRYRGYYHDTDLGMYYLQSRYYDAKVCRFISADSYTSTGQGILSVNMYAYCGNNPVMGYDPTGHWDWGGVIVGLIITIAGGVAVYLGSMSTETGALITGGVLATGVTMIIAAATDSQMVIDISYSTPLSIFYFKCGGSMVIDFRGDEANGYFHRGNGVGSNGGTVYSVGLLDDYSDPSDYAGDFYDAFGGSIIGGDHCWSPEGNYFDATKATSITFSSSGGFGFGWDTYSEAIPIFKWGN